MTDIRVGQAARAFRDTAASFRASVSGLRATVRGVPTTISGLRATVKGVGEKASYAAFRENPNKYDQIGVSTGYRLSSVAY